MSGSLHFFRILLHQRLKALFCRCVAPLIHYCGANRLYRGYHGAGFAISNIGGALGGFDNVNRDTRLALLTAGFGKVTCAYRGRARLALPQLGVSSEYTS